MFLTIILSLLGGAFLATLLTTLLQKRSFSKLQTKLDSLRDDVESYESANNCLQTQKAELFEINNKLTEEIVTYCTETEHGKGIYHDSYSVISDEELLKEKTFTFTKKVKELFIKIKNFSTNKRVVLTLGLSTNVNTGDTNVTWYLSVNDRLFQFYTREDLIAGMEEMLML
jgi:hypothetical protein